MTDNTQELDVLKYVLLKAYYQGKDGEGYSDAQIKQDKQAILDWHNKQVGAVLDRFEQACKLHYTTWGNSERMLQVSGVLKLIEAERKRLKESSDG